LRAEVNISVLKVLPSPAVSVTNVGKRSKSPPLVGRGKTCVKVKLAAAGFETSVMKSAGVVCTALSPFRFAVDSKARKRPSRLRRRPGLKILTAKFTVVVVVCVKLAYALGCAAGRVESGEINLCVVIRIVAVEAPTSKMLAFETKAIVAPSPDSEGFSLKIGLNAPVGVALIGVEVSCVKEFVSRL
jgi:hypothetical protein